MSDETDEKEEREKLPKDNFMVCPCCGKPTLRTPVTPKPELTDQWLACMITAEPFKHTYSLYDGKLRMTVTQVSAQMSMTLSSLDTMLDAIEYAEWGKTKCPVDMKQARFIAHTCASIESIDIDSQGRTAHYQPVNVVAVFFNEIDTLYKKHILRRTDPAEWAELLRKCYTVLTDRKNISAVSPAILINAVEAHARLCAVLSEIGFGHSFWEGIELA